MSLKTVIVGNETFVVDAESKNAAAAWGRRKLQVEVREVTRDDLANAGDLSNVPVVLKGGVEQGAEQEAEQAEAADAE